MSIGERNVGDARDLQRLAVVERFELSEFFEMLFDQIADLPDELVHAAKESSATMVRFRKRRERLLPRGRYLRGRLRPRASDSPVAGL